MTNKKVPLIVAAGLGLTAGAALLGMNGERWLGGNPPAAPAALSQDSGASSTAGETAATPPQPAASEATPQPAAPAPAVAIAPAPAETAPAAQPAPTAVATGEPPAATGEQQVATGEAPAATGEQQVATGEQQVATGEAPAATGEQQVATGEQQVTAAQPAAPQPAPAPAAPVPSFDTVRVEKTGEAVIAGRAEPEAQVTVLLDGQAIGTAKAASDGSFVLVPNKPLPPGSGALSLQAQTAGEAAPLTSEQQVAVIVPEGPAQNALVAVTAPDAPTTVLQKPAAAAPAAAAATPAAPVTLDAIDYDADGSIRFSGTAAPGAALRLYVDNAPLADAAADAAGRWSLAAAAVSPGTHVLRVDGLDPAGKVTARLELPFTREAPAAVAAATAPAAEAPQAPAAAPVAPAETAAATPAAPAAAAPAPALPRNGRVIIQPGNNLWRIARVIYGDGRRYTEIFDANKDLIRDPDRIYPGQIFATPKVVPPEEIDPKRRAPLTPEEAAATTP